VIAFANGHRAVARANTAGGSFDVEASDIGLAVGFFPDRIVVRRSNGDGLAPLPLAFHRSHVERDRDGDVVFVFYASDIGTYTLSVYND